MWGSSFLAWYLSFKDVFEVLGYRFDRDGKGVQGADRTLSGMASWWRDRYIYQPKCATTPMECRRALSHVCTTALKGSVNWPESVFTLDEVRAWGAKFLRLAFRSKMHAGESLDWLQSEKSLSLRIMWRTTGLPSLFLV